MEINSQKIAYKLLSSGVLENCKDYPISDLFCIRDATDMLLDYFPNEKWLLDLRNETLQYIIQKIGE